MIGQTISHFRIVEKIGQGGMGEVYLADDTTLDRKVALKFLPDAFTNDPERMARFEREAKLLASLNHTNIAGIYGLEQTDGNRFLVLEYVEGETLQARLGKGALPLEDALALCRQIAEGLEAAHEKGVIHRDLKPANVMITAEEKVKILDFGLAKAFSDETQSIDSSQSPTLTEAMTRPGVILGTAAYMSPEQAKGKSVDKRADIWAFGCILYECLTGKRAFEGETVTETLAAVIKEEPDIEKSPVKTRFLVQQCLAKDRKNRLRDIGDAMVWIGHAPETVEPELLNIKRPWLGWIIATVCFIAAFVLGYLYFGQTQVEVPEVISEISTPATSESTSFALSPDGRLLIFVATNEDKQQLWLRQLDENDAKPLKGTEGATYPFWSPDSESVGFFAEGKLKRIDIAGGMEPVPLADAPTGLGGTWNRDNVIVFTPDGDSPLYRVPARGGGDSVAVIKLDTPSQRGQFPWFLPDGQHFLCWDWGTIYIASLNSGKTRRLFLDASSPPIYAQQPGCLLFLKQSKLYVQPFDADRGEPTGDPIPIADSVEQDPYWQGGFSVSETGMLAYRTGGSAFLHQLAWFDRDGNEIAKLGEPTENLSNPEISPSYDQVAVDYTIQQLEGPGIWNVRLIEVARGVSNNFTYETKDQIYPVWSQPDGSTIVFSASTEAGWDLCQMPSNGSGSVGTLFESFDPENEGQRFAVDWSQDGKFLLYMILDPKTNRDLWVRPMSGNEREPLSLKNINTPFNERNGQFSPDGQWIAYESSNESGKIEVYVQPFQRPGRMLTVSTNGGSQPRWNPNGNELFYIAPNNSLIAVPILVTEQNLDVGDPETLFLTRIPRGSNMNISRAQYDVSRDGKRFLINTTVENSVSSPITINTNWSRGLKE